MGNCKVTLNRRFLLFFGVDLNSLVEDVRRSKWSRGQRGGALLLFLVIRGCRSPSPLCLPQTSPCLQCARATSAWSSGQWRLDMMTAAHQYITISFFLHDSAAKNIFDIIVQCVSVYTVILSWLNMLRYRIITRRSRMISEIAKAAHHQSATTTTAVPRSSAAAATTPPRCWHKPLALLADNKHHAVRKKQPSGNGWRAPAGPRRLNLTVRLRAK